MLRAEFVQFSEIGRKRERATIVVRSTAKPAAEKKEAGAALPVMLGRGGRM